MSPTDPAEPELTPTSPIDITAILAQQQHDSSGADNDR